MNLTMELRKMAQEFESRSEAQIIIETAAWCFVTVVTIFGNLLTLFIVYRKPVLRTSTNMFIASLAFTDVGHAILSALPLSTTTLAMSKWYFSNSACQYQGFIVILMVSASILTLGWTAVNRFYRVIKPAKYNNFFSRKRTKVIILLTYFLAMLAPIPYLASGNLFVFIPAKAFCFLKLHTGPFTVFLVSTYIGIPAAAIFYCYLRIYLVVRHHNAQISQSSTISAEEIEITKILFVMVFTFMCCFTPIMLIDLIDSLNGHWIMPRWVYILYDFLAMISSAMNPVIYVAMNPQFRKEYLSLLRCSPCRNKWNNAAITVTDENSLTCI